MHRFIPLALLPLFILAITLTAAEPANSARPVRPITPQIELVKQAATAALKDFAGTWQFVSVQPAGVTKDATQLVFKTDWTYAALDKDGKELWAGTYELDPTASPKIWDHRSYDALKKGGDALGIYELTGDTLKVAVIVGQWKDAGEAKSKAAKEWTGKPRPQDFKPESADVLIELRRAKTP